MAGDPRRIDGDGDSYHFSGLAWRFNHGRPTSLRHPTGWVFSPCAAAAMYKYKALQDLGGFDEAFFCYFEDVDLGFHLRLRGFRCLHVAMNIIAVFWFALRGKGRVIIRAKLDALKRIPEVWAQRQLIQSTRTIKPHELFKVLSFWPRR